MTIRKRRGNLSPLCIETLASLRKRMLGPLVLSLMVALHITPLFADEPSSSSSSSGSDSGCPDSVANLKLAHSPSQRASGPRELEIALAFESPEAAADWLERERQVVALALGVANGTSPHLSEILARYRAYEEEQRRAASARSPSALASSSVAIPALPEMPEFEFKAALATLMTDDGLDDDLLRASASSHPSSLDVGAGHGQRPSHRRKLSPLTGWETIIFRHILTRRLAAVTADCGGRFLGSSVPPGYPD